jgi:hypothetical protein
MNRRNLFPVIAGLAAATATATAAETNPLMDILAASMKDKKGVNLYVKGQQIGMLVTALDQEFVQGRSQEKSKIVVRISAIDAAALS